MADLKDVRKTVSEVHVRLIADRAVTGLLKKMEKKGPGGFVHRHEAMGCLQEEWHELIEAAHGKNKERILSEMNDLLMACMFSIASMELLP